MNPIGRFSIVGCPFYIGFSAFFLDTLCDVVILTPTRGAKRRPSQGAQPPRHARKIGPSSGLAGCLPAALAAAAQVGHLSVWHFSLASSVARLPWYLWLPDHGRRTGKWGMRHKSRFFGVCHQAANWHEHCMNGAGRIEKKKLTRASNP